MRSGAIDLGRRATIHLPQRVADNAPGDFYVEAGRCLRCCLPHAEASELMNDPLQPFDECYFHRQPQTPSELDHAIQAIYVSELCCIRYGGSNQSVVRRLHELGCEDCCDTPLIGEPAIRHVSAWQMTPVVKKSWWQWLTGGAK